MTRLLVHVEGVTEETFVREILAPHLYGVGYHAVSARLMGNARHRAHRGGIRAWRSVRDDIVHRLREDTGSFATTMVDYYALPQGSDNGWPERANTAALPFHLQAAQIESAMETEIGAAVPWTGHHKRFVGFVLMHEFEALLFSDCFAFSEGVGSPSVGAQMQAVRTRFSTPEEINDSPITAPSKRLESMIVGYEKPLYGTVGALHIGLDKMRAECPHFNNWVSKLEQLI